MEELSATYQKALENDRQAARESASDALRESYDAARESASAVIYGR